MKVRNLNLKKIVVAQILIIGLLIASLGYVVAQSATTFTISQGVYPGAPSYTIWREGSTYYAKNAYGVLLSPSGSTNASQIINNARLELKSVGGTILLMGVITITSPILVSTGDGSYDGLNIVGESWIMQGGGIVTQGTLLQTSGAIDAIQIIGGASVVSGVSISNLAIRGSGKANGKSGIVANITDQLQIHKVGIFNFENAVSMYRSDAPHIYHNTFLVNGYGLNLNSVIYGKIDGNDISDNDNDGVYLRSTYGTSYGNKIINNNFIRNYRGVEVVNVAVITVETTISLNFIIGGDREGILMNLSGNFVIEGNIIDGNSASANNTYSGIKLEQSGFGTVGRNIIRTISGTQHKYAIEESGVDYTYNNDVSHNIFMEWGTAPVLRVIPTGGNKNFYSHNVGYVTESSGNESLATGGTVTHGLAGIPTSVTVTAGEGSPTDVYLTAVGGSTFTINFGGGGTKLFYWEAKYQP